MLSVCTVCKSISVYYLCVCVVPPEGPVIEGSPEILLTAGSSYNLTCVSRGAKPLSTIEWYKDGIIVEGALTSTVSEDTSLMITYIWEHILSDIINNYLYLYLSGGVSWQEESDHKEFSGDPASGHRHRTKFHLCGLKSGRPSGEEGHYHSQRPP